VTGGPRVPTFADIEETDQEWLWPGIIPAGLLTVVFGPPKASKSTLVCEYAARVSRGDVNPDGTSLGPAAPVLLGALEDISESSTIKKLKAARADLGAIVDVSGGPDGDGLQLEMDHAGWLREVAGAYPGVALIVIDTLSSSANKPITTRPGLKAMLAPLASLAASTGAAVLLTAHSLKGNDEVPEGGRSLTSIPRQVLTLQRSKDDPGVRTLGVYCSNIASDETEGFRYRLAMRDGDQAPSIEWGYDTVRVGPGPEATAQARIVMLLANSDSPLSLQVVAAKTGVPYGTCKTLLSRLGKRGEVIPGAVRGTWTTPRAMYAAS
jgi:AAA domain-containing protein